jgi:hypothetical protein
VQRMLKEFENIAFHDGESVDDFAMRINALAADLRTSGEEIKDTRVAKKMLRVLPQRDAQIAISIETLLDLKTLTVKELVGRLQMAKDWVMIEYVTDKTGRLLLTEEDWVSRNRYLLLPESSSSSGGEKKSGYNPSKWRNRGRGDKKDNPVKLTSEGTPWWKGRCRNCGIYGHWRVDCKRPPKKEHKEEAHVAHAEQENPSLLLTTVAMVLVHRVSFDAEPVEVRTTHQVVHLNEKKMYPASIGDEEKDVWVLDMGGSIHMKGRCEALALLDASVRGTLCFGDGSLVEIEGIASVVLQMKKEGHKVLTEVYYIPKLKSNIMSLGQLEEGGCKVVLENEYCNVYDVEHLLLARAPRVSSSLSAESASSHSCLSEGEDR